MVNRLNCGEKNHRWRDYSRSTSASKKVQKVGSSHIYLWRLDVRVPNWTEVFESPVRPQNIWDKIEPKLREYFPRRIKAYNQIERQKVLAEYSQEFRIKCGKCFVACEDSGFQAIKIGKDGYPKFISDTCDGCGLCITQCPVEGCMRPVKIENMIPM